LKAQETDNRACVTSEDEEEKALVRNLKRRKSREGMTVSEVIEEVTIFTNGHGVIATLRGDVRRGRIVNL
jgi:hypothetical protein